MRILLIDFSGHPFQVQLSRALAARGNEVLHSYAASSETPKGDLIKKDGDPDGFDVRPVQISERVNKTNFVKRRSQERELGKRFAALILEWQPDVLIASNCPIETLRFIMKAKRRVGARFIFWVQDLLGEAASKVLAKKLGFPGKMVGRYFSRLEQGYLREADHVVGIAEDFRPRLDQLGVSSDRVSVIPNWSPIGDIPTHERDNDWAAEHMPDAKFRIVYSGTLGFKQNPRILVDLAEAIDGEVLIFSEGAAAEAARAEAARRNLQNLSVRGWVPFEDLPKMLAGADLFAVVLEPEAGLFSVPSKVLTYLCAGRPVLASVDPANLAAQTILDADAGVVTAPGEDAAFIAAAQHLAKAPEKCKDLGRNARQYAESAFDIDRIASKFSDIIDRTTGGSK